MPFGAKRESILRLENVQTFIEANNKNEIRTVQIKIFDHVQYRYIEQTDVKFGTKVQMIKKRLGQK